MALCPVTKSPCVKSECAWWYQAHDGKVTGCSIALTPAKIDEMIYRLDGIIIRLDRAFSEINIDGERLIGNYSDEINEIAQERNKEDK